jgi:hypothetical protein
MAQHSYAVQTAAPFLHIDGAHVMTKIPFNDPVPEPAEAGQPLTEAQPAPDDKPGRPILVPTKPKVH